MSKVKTNRQWQLEVKRFEAIGGRLMDTIDIIEYHKGAIGEEDSRPYVSIPFESIDEVIYQLAKFKRQIQKDIDTGALGEEV